MEKITEEEFENVKKELIAHGIRIEVHKVSDELEDSAIFKYGYLSNQPYKNPGFCVRCTPRYFDDKILELVIKALIGFGS